MELTADLLRDILDSLTAPPAEIAAAPEQRRGPRARADVEATLLPFSDSLCHQATKVALRDLSSGGFGFLFDRPVPLGEAFGLVLPEKDGTPSVVQCAVTYWQPLAPDLYAIGASFTNVLRQGGPELKLSFEQASQEARKVS